MKKSVAISVLALLLSLLFAFSGCDFLFGWIKGAYDIIRNLVRAGNLKDIYVITDTFNVGGKNYSKKTYIGYYE